MNVMRSFLLRQFVDVRRQTCFVTRRRVFVQNTFIDCFVNRRNCRCQQFGALIFIARRKCRTKFFDLRAKTALVAFVDCAAFGCLSNALFG